jgi:hypothetical protein
MRGGVMWKKIVSWVKNLILKADGSFSWTKFWAGATSLCAVIIAFQQYLVSQNIDTPEWSRLVFVGVGIVSFFITQVRQRNAASEKKAE